VTRAAVQWASGGIMINEAVYVWSIVFEFVDKFTRKNEAITVVWSSSHASVIHVGKRNLKKKFPKATNIEVIRLFRREQVDVQLT
jgi:hypothetical protein